MSGLLPIFNTDQGNGNGYLAAIFVVIGTGAITSAFWPGFYKTYKTKDTKGLPIKLFALFLLVGILMTAGSIAGVAKKPEGGPNYFKGGGFVYLNSFVMSVNAYTVGLGLKNKKKERQGTQQKTVDVTSDVVEETRNI